MSQFQLESNVPLPPVTRAFGVRGTKYPLDEWSVGQSFAVPVTGTACTRTKKDGTKVQMDAAQDAERRARAVMSAVATLAKKRGQKVSSRWLRDEGNVRFWYVGAADASQGGETPASDVDDLLGDE